MRCKLQLLEQLRRFTLDVGIFHAINAAEEPDVFGHGEVVIQREPLAHIANMPLDLLVLGANIKAHHVAFAARRLRQASQHAHGSGLSGAVSP